MLYDEQKLKSCGNVYIFDELTSTLDEAKNSCYGHGDVIIARRQTSARGRHGRSFYCYEGGVYFTVVIKNLVDYSLLTCATAVAVRRAIKKVLNLTLKIKWVNDLFYLGKKVCGILTEADTIDGKIVGARVGVGINFAKTRFSHKLNKIAVSLDASEELCSDFVVAFYQQLSCALKANDYMSEYKSSNVVTSKTVKVKTKRKTFCGTVIDITDRGELVLKTKSGLVTLNNGEITRCKIKE